MFSFTFENLHAQIFPQIKIQPDEEKFVVDTIKISGNEITEDFIILRELTFKVGDTVSTSILKFNSERIFSLRLFNNVDVYPVKVDDKTIVQIDVKEAWYIYPIPFLRRADHHSNSYSYGINLTIKNFRGRNENLHAVVGLGYDPFYLLLYDNPALLFKEDLGISVGATYLNSQNKNEVAKNLYGGDYKNKYYSGSLAIYKRFDQFNHLALVGMFDYVKTPGDVYFKGMSASGKNIDRVLSFGFEYNYDTRDLKQFPQFGLMADIYYLHKGFGINNVSYNLVKGEYQQFVKIFGSLTTRWRLAFRSTFGRVVPYYDYSYLGYGEYVRGHSDDEREGNNLVLSSFELSYPIINEFDFHIKLPLIPEKLTSARIGIFLTAFADAGNTFNNNEPIRIKDFYSGYGVGLTILVLPYNALRFEYAFGDNGNKEFLLGTGFAF